MRRMWTKHDLLRYAGAEVEGENTMRRMWTEQDLIELKIRTKFGDAIWNQVKDDIGISTMKRIYSEEMMHKHLQGFNFAMPDLTDKEYLGDGVYRLFNTYGITIDYNLTNGRYVINGTSNTGTYIYLTNLPIIESGQIVSRSTYYVSGSINTVSFAINFNMRMKDISNNDLYITYDNNKLENTITSPDFDGRRLRFYISKDRIFDNFTFKIQLEKGDKATPLVIYNMRSYNEMDALGLIHHPSEEEMQLMNEQYESGLIPDIEDNEDKTQKE